MEVIMIKKSLCILSLLSTPMLFSMDSGSRTVTVTEEVSAPRIISEIAQLIALAKNDTTELEERLDALKIASAQTNQLHGQAIAPEHLATLSREFATEIKGKSPIAIIANIKRAITQLRNQISEEQIALFAQIDETTATSYQAQTIEAFDAIQTHTREFGARYARTEETSRETARKVAELEQTLNETNTQLQGKIEELEEVSELMEDEQTEHDETSLKLSKQVSENGRLRTIIINATEAKRKLEKDVATYKQQADELSDLISELQKLEED
jgi:hypothetical protein